MDKSGFIKAIKNIRVESASLASFRNLQLEGMAPAPMFFPSGDFTHGWNFFLKISSGQSFRSQVSSPKKFFCEVQLFEYKRENFSVPKQKEIKGISELFQVPGEEIIELASVQGTLPKPFSTSLEEVLANTKILKYKQFKAISYVLTVASEYNYLLLISIVFFIIYRLFLLDTNRAQNPDKYCNVDISSCFLNSFQRSKISQQQKFGKFRVAYVIPTCFIHTRFIEDIYLSQSKKEKKSSKKELIFDYVNYRLKMVAFLKSTSAIMYFYIVSPVISLVGKVILSNCYYIGSEGITSEVFKKYFFLYLLLL